MQKYNIFLLTERQYNVTIVRHKSTFKVHLRIMKEIIVIMKKLTAILLAVFVVICTVAAVKTISGKKADKTDSKKVSETVMADNSVKKKPKPEKTTEKAVTGNGLSRDLEQFKDKKLIAFTFDDGPYTPVTESLLDRLDTYNARVTFFTLGSRLDENADYRNTAKKAFDMGNQIASHTYSHSTLTSLSQEQLEQEIAKANAAVNNVIGMEPDAIRPPYGFINDNVSAAMKKHIVLWGIDPEDWKYRDANTICNNIVSHAYDGGIVLLHDLYQTSVDGAIMAMEKLKDQGYAFVTVNELAQLRGVQMDISTKYYDMSPKSE